MLDRSEATGGVGSTVATEPPIHISLLGEFRIIKAGQPVSLRSGGKPETLVGSLALRNRHGMPREQLLCMLWPERDTPQAAQSLNSVVHALQKLLGSALHGSALVLHDDGRYRLNTAAGIAVDIVSFDALADSEAAHRRAGREDAALAACRQAVVLYRGDLYEVADTFAAMERERLRERYLTLLTRLADAAFNTGDYATSLSYAKRLLQTEPCREDAHRRAMRCYMRLGERDQALRQFRLCETVLRHEFGAIPEPMTQALFQSVRLEPATV